MAVATILLILTMLGWLTNNFIIESDARNGKKSVPLPKISGKPGTLTDHLADRVKPQDNSKTLKLEPPKVVIVSPTSKFQSTISEDIHQFNTRNIGPLMDFVGLFPKYLLGLLYMGV